MTLALIIAYMVVAYGALVWAYWPRRSEYARERARLDQAVRELQCALGAELLPVLRSAADRLARWVP